LNGARARRAGFRPCLRCKPDELGVAHSHREKVVRACRIIEASEVPPDLTNLAKSVGLSRHYFHRLFKRIVGITPKTYAAAHRAKLVRERLSEGSAVTEAIYAAGFNSSGSFYAKSTELLGMVPSSFRDGGANSTIHFAVANCSLGAILVAATRKGVCAILLGDDPEALMQDLQKRFSRAKLIGGDPEFDALVAKVVGLVENPVCSPELPLDVRGTAFQQKVWRALQSIPAGQTASYAEVAMQIGASRAVAQACKANAIAVAISCHRAVRSDGSLSGYRWGVNRKRRLLERETENRVARSRS
jgi:AraC family transcriptional regulator of adaptative response/methylated-DNA-[protein]-cysteine methyltransferase